MVKLFGLSTSTCDTMKKAVKWLQAENIEYSLHDYRKDGIDSDLTEAFCSNLGWEKVLNKRGTTYRKLSQDQKDTISETNIVELLVEHSAMIKRPILKVGDQYYLGFSNEQYQQIFSKGSEK